MVRGFREAAVGTRRHVTFDGILMVSLEFSQNVYHYVGPGAVVRYMSQLLRSQEMIVSRSVTQQGTPPKDVSRTKL